MGGEGKDSHVLGHKQTFFNLPNSPLKPVSLLHCTYGHSAADVCKCRQRARMELDHRGWGWGCWALQELLTTIFPHLPSTRNCKPLPATFLPTRHWAFVSFNEHRVVWKYALCSTKGNSNIIRNDYIPALQHYCYY